MAEGLGYVVAATLNLKANTQKEGEMILIDRDVVWAPKVGDIVEITAISGSNGRWWWKVKKQKKEKGISEKIFSMDALLVAVEEARHEERKKIIKIINEPYGDDSHIVTNSLLLFRKHILTRIGNLG